MPAARTRSNASSNSSRDIAKARCQPPSVPRGASWSVSLSVTRTTEKAGVPLRRGSEDAHEEVDAGDDIVDGHDPVVELHGHRVRSVGAGGPTARPLGPPAHRSCPRS